MTFALSQYLLDKETVYTSLSWLLMDIAERKDAVCKKLIEELVYIIDDPAFARYILNNEDFSENALYPPCVYLFNRLAKKTIDALKTT